MRSLISILFFFCFLSIPSFAQQPTHVEGLGSVYFPNSGSADAQDDFIRGVLLMHSFEYDSAAEAFRAAQLKDPGFVMAYWGEAMTNNHPVWSEKDMEAANDILGRVPDGNATGRENAYVAAVRQLYADGQSKEVQDRAYMDAMGELLAAYPEDDEARAFYALSILGSQDGSRDFGTYMKAAAAAAPVFERNTDHPGAAHYLIHSFDDPIHAPLGLPAADAYSEIAPNAAHAQHMTSHIFVAMGLWDRVVKANIRANGIVNRARAASGRPASVCGHYSSWLHYGHLMLGQFRRPETHGRLL